MVVSTALLTRRGWYFDLHRFSVHDGPGIRTTVFLKGCPLSCQWCHNPESQKPSTEKIVHQARCLRCGACVEICPQEGITLTEEGVQTDFNLCTCCGACADVCMAGASEMIGKEVSVGELVNLIKRDEIFYDESGGGVTFSGGEPLIQINFLEGALAMTHTAGIHTALDTSGYAPWESFLRILPFTDLFLYDLKIVDEQSHITHTGVSNRLILENLYQLNQHNKEIWLRIPLISGINDGWDQINALLKIALMIKNLKRVSLLPYHEVALHKYAGLAKNFGLQQGSTPSYEHVKQIQEFFLKENIPTTVGG